MTGRKIKPRTPGRVPRVKGHSTFGIRRTVAIERSGERAAGNPFLDKATREDRRRLIYDHAGADSASAYLMHSDETVAMIPGGRSFEARHSLAVKNVTLPGGNGQYGAGNVCLVTGDLTEYR